jgi:hypothetical protein
MAFTLPWTYGRYAGSLFIVVLALAIPMPADRLVRILAPLTLGTYLAHPLILRLLLPARIPWPSSATCAAVTLILSAALIWAMRRHRWLRRVA